MKEQGSTARQRVGACSWSLQPQNPAQLASMLDAVGVDCVQLHLDPLRSGAWSEAETMRELARANIEVRSGMMSMEGEDYSTLESIRRTGGVRPDATWDTNRAAAIANALLARRLGIRLVTFHAGFIPDDREHEDHEAIVSRLRELADIFAAQGVSVGLETGQEDALTMIRTLAVLDRYNISVNFDPANMILYGIPEPVQSMRLLVSVAGQIHIKDAKPSNLRDAWGEEVRVGTGRVDWDKLFELLRKQKRDIDWMIEREAGADRIADMRAAREFVQQFL